MYTFSVAVHIVNVYKFSGTHFIFLIIVLLPFPDVAKLKSVYCVSLDVNFRRKVLGRKLTKSLAKVD